MMSAMLFWMPRKNCRAFAQSLLSYNQPGWLDNMIMQNTIESKLTASFDATFLEVQNESHMHNVAPGSESHFKVTLVSNEFEGLMLIKRHRLVNKALEQELQKIHALALHTMTASEWAERGGNVVASPPCQGGGKNQ